MIKYICHILAFTAVYIIAMFAAPVIADSRVQVYAVLGVVLALEYAYVWFFAKGRFFSIPISFLVIMIFGAFYFNNPSNPDMELGMWVLAKYLVLPYAITACAASTVMYFVKKQLNIGE